MAFNTDLAFDVIARDKASKTFHDVGRGADAVGTKLAGFAKAGAAAVAGFALAGAAAVTALAGVAAQFALAKSKSDALLAGQLRATGPQAKDLGRAAGQLYVDGWAESVEQAGAAIRATVRAKLVDKNAGAEAIEAMSTRTAALAADMEDDFGRVAVAVSQMLRTGIAGSAEEAFDLLHAATAAGVNDSQDLLDTIKEYGTQFRSLGIDGPQALGLMSQALQAGARDADTVADALKEFAIRSKDGSATSARAFKALGLDAGKMFQIFARGGPEADAAMKLVIDRLKAMTDPVKRNTAAVELFGTKAEDLQDALFALDPTTAAAALGRVTNASNDFIKSQESAGQRLDKIWKGTLAATADKLLPVIEKIIGKLDEWGNDPEVQAWLKDLNEELEKVGEVLIPEIVAAWDSFTGAFKDNKDEITLVVVGLVAGLAALVAGFFTLAGAAAYAVGFMVNSFRTMVAFALSSIGVFIGASEAAFSWIPGLGPKLTKAKAEFAAFAQGVNEALAGIKDRHVKVHVTARGTKFTTGGSIPFGGGFQEMAHGGPAVKDRPYIVGDGGRPELFVPDQDGTILPRVPTGAGVAAAGASSESTVLEFRGDGTRLGDLLIEIIRHAVRVRGRGNVQVAFGR